jgi:hypothetical protein
LRDEERIRSSGVRSPVPISFVGSSRHSRGMPALAATARHQERSGCSSGIGRHVRRNTREPQQCSSPDRSENQLHKSPAPASTVASYPSQHGRCLVHADHGSSSERPRKILSPAPHPRPTVVIRPKTASSAARATLLLAATDLSRTTRPALVAPIAGNFRPRSALDRSRGTQCATCQLCTPSIPR